MSRKRIQRDHVPAITGGLVLSGLELGGSTYYRGIRQVNPLNTMGAKVPTKDQLIQRDSLGALNQPSNRSPITQFADTKIPVGYRIPFNQTSVQLQAYPVAPVGPTKSELLPI